ncbi:MAG TPA: peptidase E [Phototrophicaceae bacterium]|nr:peptidase E [Phototrophicaceae bacterium]
MQQIITLGGGDFAAADMRVMYRYILEQSGVAHPKISFLPQAGGENLDYIVRFYRLFVELGAIPSHLSLFNPHTAAIEDYLMAQNVIYVGGGNTKSMLALWREWGLDQILHNAANNGTVLAGVSAGAICWYEAGSTDSIPGRLSGLPCLGYLRGSCSPHYDGEPLRRPEFQRMISSGELPAGVAFDDGAAGHFIDGQLAQVISARPNAKGYRVERDGAAARETVLDTRFLKDADHV